MSETEERACEILINGPHTCTELGEKMWPNNRHGPRQSHARIAGKVIRGLMKKGEVKQVFPIGHERRPAQYAHQSFDQLAVNLAHHELVERIRRGEA